ncbi:hypothetical protein PMAYCL1PPCAC_11181, partial [Pristionchus mayeri]
FLPSNFFILRQNETAQFKGNMVSQLMFSDKSNFDSGSYFSTWISRQRKRCMWICPIVICLPNEIPNGPHISLLLLSLTYPARHLRCSH